MDCRLDPWRGVDLPIRESQSGVYVDGLSQHIAGSAILLPVMDRVADRSARMVFIVCCAETVYEVLGMLEKGARRKVVATTALNRVSSRAHTLFTIQLERKVKRVSYPCVSGSIQPSICCVCVGQLTSHNRWSAPEVSFRSVWWRSIPYRCIVIAWCVQTETLVSRLTFVDLAGSERVSKTAAGGCCIPSFASLPSQLETVLPQMASSLKKQKASISRCQPLETSLQHWRPRNQRALLCLPCVGSHTSHGHFPGMTHQAW
jgi:hypothetical protein